MIDRIRNIIGNYVDCDPETIDHNTVIWDLGLTSFDIINIIAECETEFNVYIPERDIHLLQTVDDMIIYLQTNLDGGFETDEL